MMKLISIFVFLLVAAGSGAEIAGARIAVAQISLNPDAEEVRVLTLENAWNQAVQQKDAAALTMLLALDLIYVEVDGTLMNRAEYVASVEAPSLHPVRIVNEGMNVHLYGKVAVVTGVYHESGVKNGKAYALLERFTDTWVLRGNNWMCVASQSTRVAH